MLSSDEKSELMAWMRREIARQLNTILNGESGPSNTKDTDDISEMFPGMPTLVERPVVQPYGFVSRAPENTLSVSARNGDHPGARYVIGYRDKNRPDHERGEVVVYNVRNKQVRLELGAIRIGGTDSAENLVLGQQLKAFLTELDAQIQAIAAAVGTVGGGLAGIAALLSPSAFVDPINGPGLYATSCGEGAAGAGAAAAAGSAVGAADSAFVANDAILSDESFTRKGG